ncbi:hypothetical protein [Kineosporia mesophila]|uniref:hypothetical protein n=1 Tax=Kineosporia mesophila TaxID=566012 RepID=UPI001E43BA9D|nr:hypothetical protein [Kineosporia mesophila]MCD5351961.1 hypothetical protein [Kineosporia mesophila]
MAEAPEGSTALEIAASALRRASSFFPKERREFSIRRAAVVTANPALHERELLKMAGLAVSLTAAIHDRGIPHATARLAAESCLTVLGVSFERWIQEGETAAFHDLAIAILAELVAALTPPSSSDRRPRQAD